MNTHELVIAGQSLTVRSGADPAYVDLLAAELEQRVEAAGRSGAGPTRAIMLAALGLADELTRTREDLERLRAGIIQRAAALRAAVDAQ